MTPEQEEFATYYAKHLGSEHVKNEVFNRNFFKDWLKLLNLRGTTKHRIQEFELCDFSPIRQYLDQMRSQPHEKQRFQAEVAVVDGKARKIGLNRCPHPGLFLGRGSHPLAGRHIVRSILI